MWIQAEVQVTHRFLPTHGVQPEPVVILRQRLYSQQRPRPGQRQNTLVWGKRPRHFSKKEKLCDNESMQRMWIFNMDLQRASVFTRAIHKLLRTHEQHALEEQSWHTGRLYRAPSRTSCPTCLWFYGHMISVWQIPSRPAKEKKKRNQLGRIVCMKTN